MYHAPVHGDTLIAHCAFQTYQTQGFQTAIGKREIDGTPCGEVHSAHIRTFFAECNAVAALCHSYCQKCTAQTCTDNQDMVFFHDAKVGNVGFDKYFREDEKNNLSQIKQLFSSSFLKLLKNVKNK